MLPPSGTRILIVEDEPLLLLEIQDVATELGFEIVGTASRLERALELSGSASYDVAILDMNLHGERIDPVAAAISERGVPIVFLTGYSGDFEGRPLHGKILEKPCPPEVIAHALQEATEVRK